LGVLIGKEGRTSASQSADEGAADGDRKESRGDAMEEKGVVYFRQTKDGRFIKIGCS
jgi:hypothetical protein